MSVRPEHSHTMFDQAFLALYDDHADALLRFFLLRIRSRDEAKDLVQETFVRVWEYGKDGVSLENPRAFLYTVARNLTIDFYRKKKAESLDALLEKGLSLEGEDGSSVEHAAEYGGVLKAIEGLTDEYKETLQLRFIDDLSPKDIATVLGVSENVVSVRIHRGLEKLKGHLHAA